MDMLLHLENTGSTNDDAYALALKGAAHGFGVLADTQVSGKGRLGKQWLSPVGTGLYCSIILRPNLPFTEFPKLTLTAGLALCGVVETLLPEIPFGLKWPNDLYCSGKKCGGILVESSSMQSNANTSFVVVGIGLNVNTLKSDFQPELRQSATSLFLQSGMVFNVRELYSDVQSALLAHLRTHEAGGFASILDKWRNRDILLGKEMQWLTNDGKVITACGLGPDSNGQLLARDRKGKIHEILSGDVQLAENGYGREG